MVATPDDNKVPMLRSTFFQLTFTAINPKSLGLPKNAFERILHDRLTDLVSLADFAGFYHPEGGPGSCCPLALFAMVLLQARYDTSDDETASRARRDMGWKYAMQLGFDERPPSESSFRRFRNNVRERLGESFVHDRVLRLAKSESLIQDAELQVIDSTNTDCRGAVLDTFNLIARAIGQVLRRLAAWSTEPVEELAERLWLSAFLARSVKSSVDINWTKDSERDALLTREVREAVRLVAALRSPEIAAYQPPAELVEAVDLLHRVAHQDVEQLADGSYRIRKGTAPGRIVSITDPQARHGRKSSSKVITGHKTHLLGTIDSQFITAILVTDAATHDGAPCLDLLRQATARELKPTRTLGDLAYGSGANRRECAAFGVAILTKVAASSARDVLPKTEFTIDLGAMRVTCPAGQVTDRHSLVTAGDGSEEKVAQFTFDRATCAACPLAQQCCADTRRGKPRTLKLSPFEPELQQTKAFNQTPESRPLLRKRSAVERLISHVVRLGMRSARYFGQKMAQFQAFQTAAAYNLQRVATLLAAKARAASG